MTTPDDRWAIGSRMGIVQEWGAFHERLSGRTQGVWRQAKCPGGMLSRRTCSAGYMRGVRLSVPGNDSASRKLGARTQRVAPLVSR